MTRNIPGPDDAVPPSQRSLPQPRIPGIIEGSMTAHPELGGGVSFRVLIGVDDGQTAECDLLELIISAEHVGQLSRVLADYRAGIIGESDSVPSFPCHIGFCRNAVSSAARRELTGQRHPSR